MKKLAIASGLVALSLISLSSPALADPIDISANMTIDHSTFESGELNAESVAITFPLVTNIAGDRLYIDLPVGYVLGASAGVSGVQSYDPVTGICGGFDTGITIPDLPGNSFTCLSTPDFPFEFLISGDVPNLDYVINLAPHSFRAKTTNVDEAGEITITLAMSGDPQVTDDFGSVAVTTLAKKLANTGIDTFATVAAGALAAVTGLAAISVVALRRRARS
jgi:hypothetical protein